MAGASTGASEPRPIVLALSTLEGFLAAALRDARRVAPHPSYAEQLESIALDVAHLSDDSVDAEVRLQRFDALRVRVAELASSAPHAARSLVAGIHEALAKLREPLLDHLGTTSALPAIEGARVRRASLRVPESFDISIRTPFRVSSLEAGQFYIGEQLQLGLGGHRPALEARTRDTLEDLAALGSLRRLDDDEPGSRALAFEERLLANLDYLAALGRGLEPIDIVGELSNFLSEAVVVDSGRVFACAFTLACASNRGPVAGLRRLVLSACEANATALVDSLVLGSSPHLPELLADLTQEDEHWTLVVALRACARRGFAPRSVADLLNHPAPDVSRLAATAVRHHSAVASVIPKLCDMADTNTPEGAAALMTLAVVGEPSALPRARDIAAATAPKGGEDPRLDTAAAIIALRAEKRDATLLVAAAARAPSGLAWLGWYGAPTHFEIVASAVDSDRSGAQAGDDIRSPAWRAVDRLLSEDDARAVRAHPEMIRSKLDAVSKNNRVRRGAPWSLRGVLDELAQPAAAAIDRRLLCDEASIHLGRAVPIDPEGWMLDQQSRAANLAAELGRA